MSDITNIASPSTASGSDVSGNRGINGAKSAKTSDAEQKSQDDEVSFQSSFQQSLAAISDQSEQPEASADGNILPPGDEAAASFRLVSDPSAIADNTIATEVNVTDPRQQTSGSASAAATAQSSGLAQLTLAEDGAIKRDSSAASRAVQSAASAQGEISETGVISGDSKAGTLGEPVINETKSWFASHMRQLVTDQSGQVVTDRRAFDMLLSADRSPSVDTANTLHTPAPMNTPTLDSSASIPGQTTLAETFGKPEWGQGLGRQVLWMANQNMHSAEMRLNPAHLGPIEVRIKMDDDQVSVAFNSQHAVVREALETAIPRLREMFESNGMNLSNADISHQSFAEQHSNAFGDNEQRQDFSTNLSSFNTDTQAAPHESGGHVVNVGLVDCYI
jgi:flagellar hook-length control protein FliK